MHTSSARIKRQLQRLLLPLQFLSLSSLLFEMSTEEAIAKALNSHSADCLHFLGGRANSSAVVDFVGEYFTGDDPDEFPNGKV